MKEVLLTGLRTNAEYHLGNYIGGIKPIIQMAQEKADQYQVNLFAPDLHSFTTEIDHSTFYDQTMDNINLFLACGLPYEHDGVNVYRQSRIPAHSELAWILSNFTGFGEMSRMVEFKEKAERQNEDRVSVGLFTYPTLMAADILLYDASWVPVGEDQRQHLEFTRDIAERFNNRFGEVFTVPKSLKEQQEFIGREESPRIRSLRDPAKKMSKSISDPAGTIQLSDSPDEARKKIMSATTDSVGAVHYDWDNQPGVTNLLQIISYLSDKPQPEVNGEWDGNERYGDLKSATADVVCETLEKIQNAMKEVDEGSLESILADNEARMNQQAVTKLEQVQKAIGLRR